MVLRTRPLSTILILIGIISAIVVTVAHPNRRYALVVIALELVGRAGGRRAVQLVFTKRAVGSLITPEKQFKTVTKVEG